MNDQAEMETGRRIVLAFYNDHERAKTALDRVVQEDFPLDRISLLGRVSGSGDDPLGVYYATPAKRMKAWGGMGAFWGGLWGLLTGAAGMFLIPGVGPVLAAGPVVGALASGAAGAALGGGIMAGGAAVTQLAIAAHRMGVPEERLEETQDLLRQGYYLMILIVGEEETGRWRDVLTDTGAEPLWDFPYAGVTDSLHEALSD
jgi:hypothetical protein